MEPTADYQIDIDLKQKANGTKYAVPRLMPDVMYVGKTVLYRSADGDVRIEFHDLDISDAHSSFHSPYVDPNDNERTIVTSLEPPITLAQKGTFIGRCYVTPPGQQTAFGWSTDNPESGGNHVVK